MLCGDPFPVQMVPLPTAMNTAPSGRPAEGGAALCVRLTSNRPMEAVVWLVCITSVSAHICWRLDDTVCGSGRP